MFPAKVLAAAELAMKFTAAEPELVIVPPLPGRVLALVKVATAWLLPPRSNVPAFTPRLSRLGTVAVGCTRMVLFPPLSSNTPPLI